MIPTSLDITTLWANLVIEELIRCGVTTFVVSPGSRSTPLVLALGGNPKAEIVTHLDERGAAFFALGHSRATHGPTALICTSGTAVANYLPAVIEASMDDVPLVVLSADRPPELHGTGANQTIEQANLFGEYCRWRFTIPCPDEEIPPEFVLTTIDQAVYRATRTPAGPVHLNLEYREPLAPRLDAPVASGYLSPVQSWLNTDRPFTRYTATKSEIAQDEIVRIADTFARAESGLLVLGRLKQTDAEVAAVTDLIKRLGWPVVTDVGSGFRLGGKWREDHAVQHLPFFDLTLLNPKSGWYPDCVLHLGGPVVSRRVTEFLASLRHGEYISVSDHRYRQDPGHRVARRIECDIPSFARALTLKMTSPARHSSDTPLLKANRAVAETLATNLHKLDALCEPLVPTIIARELPSDHALFLASSMPIRDFDMFAPTGDTQVKVGCNRGASGIDGTVASAVGFARGLGRAVTLVIGDLALLHDLNSLLLLANQTTPAVTVVVINNGGGAIFSLLPVASLSKDVTSAIFNDKPELFEQKIIEKLFLTIHTFRFESAAKMFGLAYHHPATADEFRRMYREAVRGNKSTLIELTFDWRSTRTIRRELQDKIIAGSKQVVDHA